LLKHLSQHEYAGEWAFDWRCAAKIAGLRTGLVCYYFIGAGTAGDPGEGASQADTKARSVETVRVFDALFRDSYR
jgi:hypothetical protein